MLFQDGFSATASGAEDVSRRLAVAGQRIFVLIQDSLSRDSSAARHSYILAFDSDLRLVDTVATLPAMRVYRVGQGRVMSNRPTYLALFDTRPLMSALDDRILWGWSGDTVLHMETVDGLSHSTLTWPKKEREITEADRHDVALLTARRTALLVPGAADAARAMTAAQYDAQVDRLETGLPFARVAPEVVAAYVTAHCAWLSGFTPGDQTDGTSLTLVGLGLKTGERAVAVRASAPDGRVRLVDDRDVFVSYLDSLGTPLLERLPPKDAGASCGAE
jgi:hypothetical protein